MDAAIQMWFMNEQSTNLKLKTWFLAWNNVKTLTQSQQQPQGPTTYKKEVDNQIDNQNHNALCSPKVLSLQALGLV